MKYNHLTPVQIRFNDIDIVGHVNNAVYQEYFDRARIEYFKDCFSHSIDWNKKGFVIASIHIDFFNPVFQEDKITVATKVESLGEKSLKMIQYVIREGESEPVATGTTIMVAFDYSRRESVELPNEWKEMLEEFEERKLY